MDLRVGQLDNHIADLSRRLDRLETGGKPSVLVTDMIEDTFSLGPVAEVVKEYELTWPDSDVDVNPRGFAFIDVLSDNVIVPFGVDWATAGLNPVVFYEIWYPEHKLSADTTKSYVNVYLRSNLGIATQTIKIRRRWSYFAGGSASQ